MKQLYKWGGVIASLLLASALVFSGCSSGSDSESSGGGETSATSGGTSGGESGGGSGGGSGGSGGGGGVSLGTPLTLKALTEGTIVVSAPKSGMQYSLNGGAKTAVTSTITVAAGDTVAFYGSGTSITSYNGTKIAGGTAEVKAYGNIMSLVDEEGFATATSLADSAFTCLFQENAKLKDAGELLLPATTLAQSCYDYMFYGCTSLTAAPALPATSLADYCYTCMFRGCTSLTAAPVLPATTLVSCCYDGMFWQCSNLNAVTCLATNISATDCTRNWLSSVAANGTFTTPSSTNWQRNSSGIPSGWTRENSD